METQRKTGGRDELNALWAVCTGVALAALYSVQANPGLANGEITGNLKTSNAVDFTIAGQFYTKAATDNFWDFSGETDTGAGEYRAYWLYVDSAGTASFVAGSEASTEAAALQGLPDPDVTKSIFGAFVAAPNADFDGDALDGLGTIINGVPSTLPGGSLAPRKLVPA